MSKEFLTEVVKEGLKDEKVVAHAKQIVELKQQIGSKNKVAAILFGVFFITVTLVLFHFVLEALSKPIPTKDLTEKESVLESVTVRDTPIRVTQSQEDIYMKDSYIIKKFMNKRGVYIFEITENKEILEQRYYSQTYKLNTEQKWVIEYDNELGKQYLIIKP